jgi:hypothetical protein
MNRNLSLVPDAGPMFLQFWDRPRRFGTTSSVADCSPAEVQLWRQMRSDTGLLCIKRQTRVARLAQVGVEGTICMRDFVAAVNAAGGKASLEDMK